MNGVTIGTTKVGYKDGWTKRIGRAAVFGWFLTACTGPGAPLDPKVRAQIDSVAFARIQQVRVEVDSWCAQERERRLPLLVDSLRHRRLQEIERKLQTLPQ